MNKYKEMLDVVATVALEKQLDPEELTIIIMEGAYLNCPDIYKQYPDSAMTKFSPLSKGKVNCYCDNLYGIDPQPDEPNHLVGNR